MRLPFFYRCVIACILIPAAGDLSAQAIKGGTVKYEYFLRYDFQTLFAGFEEQWIKDWVASLPTESEGLATLAFSEQHALYDAHLDARVLPQNLKDAQAKASFMRTPRPELKKMFFDFKSKQIIRQVEFMTRDFLVTDEIKNQPWKLTNRTVKILDYICMGAELKKKDRTIYAYFTSEIPFSLGPDEYYGLPGLILAVEIDGETAFLARSIELSPPEKGVVCEPDDGVRVTQQEFEKIMEDKIRQVNENSEGKWEK